MRRVFILFIFLFQTLPVWADPEAAPTGNVDFNGDFVWSPSYRPNSASQFQFGATNVIPIDLNSLSHEAQTTDQFGRPNTSSQWRYEGDISSLNPLNTSAMLTDYRWENGNLVYCPESTLDPAISTASAPVFGDNCLQGVTIWAPEERDNAGKALDLQRCRCLDNDRSIAGYLARPIEPLYPDVAGINRNIARLSLLLENEQNAMRFHGSTLPNNEVDGRVTTAAYTTEFNFSAASARVNERLQTLRNNKSNEGIDQIEVRPADDALLNDDQMPENYCIPLRTFLASRQMPRDNQFYADLASMNAFNSSEWDYVNLNQAFIRRAARFNTLNEVLQQDPEAKKLYLRMEFLNYNPLFKNLFSAPEVGTNANAITAKKRELFNMIKTRLSTTDNCGAMPGRDACIYRMNQNNAFGNLREESRRFFCDGDVMAMTQDGANRNLSTILEHAPGRVTQLTADPPQELWMQATMAFQKNYPEEVTNGTGAPAFSAEALMESSRRDNPTVFGYYCPLLRAAQYQSNMRVQTELEERFGNTFTSDPYANEEYARLNRTACSETRVNMDGEAATFPMFVQEACTNNPSNPDCLPQNRLQLLATFTSLYHLPGGEDSQDVLALQPLLRPGNAPVSYSDDSVREIVNIRRTVSSGNSNINDRLAEISISGGSTVSRNSVARINNVQPNTSTSTTSTNTATASRTQPASDLSPALPNIPFAAAAAIQPVAEAPQAAPEIRSQIRQTEGQAQQFRDQLTDLRQSLERENSAPPSSRNSSVISDLNRRIDELDRRLSQKTDEIERLRSQLAIAEAPRTTVPRVASSRSEDGSVRSAPQGVTAGSSSAGNSGGSAPSTVNSAPVSSGASLGPSAPSLSRSSGRSINSALLNRSAAAVTPGAITVSAAPSAAEYQELKDQSANSFIADSVPLSEFQQFSQNNQSALDRYLDQVRAMPGEVVRLAITAEGTGQELELFFVKNGSQISLVPAGQVPGTATNRAPASVPERTNRLEDLNREIERSR